MKCELCKQHAAEAAIKQVVDGEERELFVCPSCAQRAAGAMVTSIVELLLGAAIDLQLPDRDTLVCSGCGLSRTEFRKRARVGCARCYETFARELAPMLRDMHSGDQHVGKVPARERINRTRSELETALLEAVRNQRFEEAALLRDRIRTLQAAASPPPPGDGHAAS
ncbi:MAG: UvrB/UvrC motif-containing protein [Kiritimatiellia bacterium]